MLESKYLGQYSQSSLVNTLQNVTQMDRPSEPFSLPATIKSLHQNIHKTKKLFLWQKIFDKMTEFLTQYFPVFSPVCPWPEGLYTAKMFFLYTNQLTAWWGVFPFLKSWESKSCSILYKILRELIELIFFSFVFLLFYLSSCQIAYITWHMSYKTLRKIIKWLI